MDIKLLSRILPLSVLITVIFCSKLSAQEPMYDNEGFEIFMHEDKDTVYTMKKYFICFLKAGPNRSAGPEEAKKLQEAHLKHMSDLAEEDKICIAGPFGDDTSLRGIVIYNAKTLEEAQSYANGDPMVKAGWLTAEIHPWWAAKGSKLF